MKIMIDLDGLVVGPFSQEEAKALIAIGTYSENDRARTEDASDWVALRDIISASESAPLASSSIVRSVAPAGFSSESESGPLTAKVTAFPMAPLVSPPVSEPSPTASPVTTRSVAPSDSPTRPRPSWLASKAGSGPSASTSKPSKPSVPTTSPTTRSVGLAGAQARPSRPAPQAKANSPASTGVSAKAGRRDFRDRSSGSASAPEKRRKLNRVLVFSAVTVGFLILILIPVLLMVFDREEMEKLLDLTNKAVVDFILSLVMNHNAGPK